MEQKKIELTRKQARVTALGDRVAQLTADAQKHSEAVQKWGERRDRAPKSEVALVGAARAIDYSANALMARTDVIATKYELNGVKLDALIAGMTEQIERSALGQWVMAQIEAARGISVKSPGFCDAAKACVGNDIAVNNASIQHLVEQVGMIEQQNKDSGGTPSKNAGKAKQ